MIALRIRTYKALPDRALILETTAQDFRSVAADQPLSPILLHEIQFKGTRGRLMFFGIGALSQALAIAVLLAIPIFFPKRFGPIRQYLVSSLEPAPAEYISPRIYHPIVAHQFRERLLAPGPTAAP